MVRKVTTQLVDDLSGDVIEPGDGRTVQFSFDGSSYEIDLTEDNTDKLRGAFSDYIAAARKISSRNNRGASALTSASPASKTRSDPNELAKIRVWAMANGHEVAARGRISQQVRDAFDAAN